MLKLALFPFIVADILSRTIYKNDPKLDHHRRLRAELYKDLRPLMLHRRLFNLP